MRYKTMLLGALTCLWIGIQAFGQTGIEAQSNARIGSEASAQSGGSIAGGSAGARSSASADTGAGGLDASHSTDAMARARARIVRGDLGPKSEPGDRVVFRLEEDARSEQGVVLRRGAEVTGTVQSVGRAEVQREGRTVERSFVNVLWEVSGSGRAAARPMTVAMDALAYVHPFARHRESTSGGLDVGGAGSGGAQAGSGGGGLVGGLGAGVTGSGAGGLGSIGAVAGSTAGAAAGGLGGSIASTADLAGFASASPSAIDASSTSAIAGALALDESSGVFQLGHGVIVSPQGDAGNVNLLTRFSNDTILETDPDAIQMTSGAEGRLLFGVPE